ncbi:MAG TPA: hypothetical protein DIC22_12820 [Chitinophagaceae bacterium]|jgi:hypothetical protein|nr:hypothetical protein [Chitinophagaceae bacterium]
MMQRRKFIQLAAMGSAAVGMTGTGCHNRHPAFYSILDKPGALSQICDLQTVREIGKAYRLQAPSESDAGRLVALLSSDSAGNPIPSASDNAFVQGLIRQKIGRDFETGNTVIVKGWILAVTEARQCALLYVNNQ